MTQPPIPAPPDAVKLLARRILEIGYDDLPARERQVLERVARRMAVSRDWSASFEEGRTFGERLADRIASFGGSWTFIMLFGLAIAMWVAVNTVLFFRWGGGPLRPLPLHPAQPFPVAHRRHPGTGHHDVAEPPGGEGPAAGQP